MAYDETVSTLAREPARLEELYQTAVAAGESEPFRQAIAARYAAAPDNLLYAAWYYRLRETAVRAKTHAVAWAWVIPLALLNGLLFWWLSSDLYQVNITRFGGQSWAFLPLILLVGGPLAAICLLIYLAANGRGRWPLAALIGLGLSAAAAYVWWVYPRLGTIPFQEQYLTLMVPHLALLAWAGVGAFLLAGRPAIATNRFAFLLKSLEVFILGGLFAIAAGIFTVISIGLFQALDVNLSEGVQRLFIAGSAGLIPVVVTAVLYNPALPPAGQSFDEGLSKLMALLLRVLLPLTLLVLLVYVAFIPFNFRAPFENRDVLIIYNAMLFAVVALLVGATPLRAGDVPPRLAPWLRRGIVAVAALALLIGLYALAAIVSRTAVDRLTPNRLAFIGWNVINIGLLALLLLRQARAGAGTGGWLAALHSTFSAGALAYAVWGLALILLLPWLFGIDQGEIAALPEEIQRIIYEQPDPVLLKCAGSDPIYLLENGQKRWIDSIATFEARGYVWRDVAFVNCANLGAVPDGVPIPPDAGPPPQP